MSCYGSNDECAVFQSWLTDYRQPLSLNISPPFSFFIFLCLSSMTAMMANSGGIFWKTPPFPPSEIQQDTVSSGENGRIFPTRGRLVERITTTTEKADHNSFPNLTPFLFSLDSFQFKERIEIEFDMPVLILIIKRKMKSIFENLISSLALYIQTYINWNESEENNELSGHFFKMPKII